MARLGYSRRHYERLSNGGPDTPATILDRQRRQQACDLTRADIEAKYPQGVTLENAEELLAYQQARLEHHIKTLKQEG